VAALTKQDDSGGILIQIRRKQRPSMIELGQDARGKAEESCTRLCRGRDGVEEKKRGRGLGWCPYDRRGEEKEVGYQSHAVPRGGRKMGRWCPPGAMWRWKGVSVVDSAQRRWRLATGSVHKGDRVGRGAGLVRRAGPQGTLNRFELIR
jgi:hypothetical protein